MKLKDPEFLKIIAKKTHGFVGADLGQLCTEAGLEWIWEETKDVNIDLEEINESQLANMYI